MDKDPRDYHGRTPLHFVAYGGHLEIIKYIVMYLEDIDPKLDDGRTPRLIAQERGYNEVVDYLESLNNSQITA